MARARQHQALRHIAPALRHKIGDACASWRAPQRQQQRQQRRWRGGARVT
jgi:hypothetical protein